MAEEDPLIEQKIVDDAPSGVVRKGVLAASGVSLLWLAAGAVSSGVGRPRGGNAKAANLKTMADIPVTQSVLSMMKRTHLSQDSVREGSWLTHSLGFGPSSAEYWVNSTGFSQFTTSTGDDATVDAFDKEALRGHGHNSMDLCASRSLFYWEGQKSGGNEYDWHNFQGTQTPAGPLGPDYWWDLFYQYNTQVEDETVTGGDQWNVFLNQGQHMYVQDLAAHMKAFEEDGTPHLARHYKAVTKEDEGKVMYVVFVPNKYNGNTVIIHSKAVSVDKFRSKFTELEATACVHAVAVPYSTAMMDHWVDDIYVVMTDSRGMSKPIPVMDTKPTYDIDEVEAYFTEGIKIHTWGATIATHENKDTTEPTCKVFEVHMRSQMATAYQMRFVYTPEARNHEEVGRFHNYVDKQVRETTGYNTGYSRWMDEHYAITIANAQDLYLDQVRTHLEDAKSPYHVHVTEIIGKYTTGSIWSWAVSGMGIEWHGYIDYSSFHKPIGGFDFCTADTTCLAQDSTCLDVANWTSTDDDLTGATLTVKTFGGDPVAPFSKITDRSGRTITVGDEGENPL